MKIQCQSCQAKYTIADEKVLGKVVKIRCKKCSATIVINGNETRPAEDNADTNVFDYGGQGGEQWTVNVADGDQRTLTAQEIVAEYRAGVVNDETYCWKDGMGDWLPLREIEQLYGAVKLSPRASYPDDEISIPPQSIQNPPQSAGAPLFASPAADPQPVDSSPFAGGAPHSGNGGALFGGGGGGLEQVQAAPAAARRAGGRAQGADLFGNVSTAGGEEDVMTSAANAAMAANASADDQKLTGQRNENSVLFSLSALTEGADAKPASSRSVSGGGGGGSSENKTTATSDGSGLIDIRALSANMGDEGGSKKDKGSRVDDIMNLSGGGAFGAALAAPILAPPPLEMAQDPGYAQAGGQKKSSAALLFGIIGAGAFIAIAIVVAVLILRPTTPVADGTKPDGTNTTATTSPTGTGTTTTPTGDTTAAATNTVAANDTTPPPPGTGEAQKKDPGHVVAANAPKTGGDTAPAHPDKPVVAAADPPKTDTKPASLADSLATAAGQPKAADPNAGGAGGSSAPFDRGAAAAAIGNINVQSCKKPDGPTGSGHVKITFAPNGSVSSAVIDSGPFPGTAVGGCIAGKYRGAHVPAFAGAPVPVGKTFTIN